MRNFNHALLSTLCLVALFAVPVQAAENDFARKTIDLGVVVSDVEKSAKFYTEVLGFTEVESFSVPADFCKAAGLTDGKKLDIRVFVLGEGKDATRIKLMEVPAVKSKKSDNSSIHAQLGFSYLTVFVTDTDAALARLKKAGVKPQAEGPVALPKGFPEGVFLTLVADPDGNLIELIGPKAGAQ